MCPTINRAVHANFGVQKRHSRFTCPAVQETHPISVKQLEEDTAFDPISELITFTIYLTCHRLAALSDGDKLLTWYKVMMACIIISLSFFLACLSTYTILT